MRTVIQIVLVIAAIGLTYKIYDTVNHPIQFEKERKARYSVVVKRLKDIRKAEQAYKETYGKFTGSFDTLIDFVKHDSLPVVRQIGTLTDSMQALGWDEAKAIKKGAIIRDTVFVSVLDTIFGRNFQADQLRYVPVKDTVAEFYLGATIITTGSGLKVPHAECKVHNNTFLKGLDRQLIINMSERARKNTMYPGLKFGSMTETNNLAGNWE
ncbi:hypothetical protein EMN47_08670 [Prolixibacteraceae bacterium JC049]|nr:hypothetical protein [Prolixibacteraceae bacterium JC049]